MPAAEPHDLVRTELDRVARRWRDLPVDRALAAAPGLRRLAQELADETAARQGRPVRELPDLGPAVLLDQLLVTCFDATEAGVEQAGLAQRLSTLRSKLTQA
ncbi:hypothetical protein MM440_09910 [Arsenicicoccus piscis]|uniref:Uncharacterized protein n=1 Tax=Arsenicicoccus piscis TaxID=673954 RepID=A0ABQ6HQS1_9MICO|nr:hypothetical protein [Arsenicicoccus piscis]MCH8628082.1 hypothetical protein [Arsenicicoccus piscis]GMA20555.1 hypothetical protein GCM10025862_25760 [Arsenicicoccus piscis]